MTSLIKLVRESCSLSITVALDQLIVLISWFSWFAWSVRADLLISAKPAVRWLLMNTSLVFDSHSVLCYWSLTPSFLPYISLVAVGTRNLVDTFRNLYRVCLWGVPVCPLGFSLVSLEHERHNNYFLIVPQQPRICVLHTESQPSAFDWRMLLFSFLLSDAFLARQVKVLILPRTGRTSISFFWWDRNVNKK